ncbi:MAG TPA: metalloregulator ArsR/SmtB family transcription factor, partial [Chitinophagaceae bacterium]|nr:metalloregulator ArsR/SmtB family transcription factor [Chitinophagaceae bacterium]
VAAILRSINHKLRQSIIKLLEEKDNLTVTEIYVKLRVEQSVASQHLAILRRAEFVKTNRVGKNIHYTLNHDRLNEVNQFIKQVLNNENE